MRIIISERKTQNITKNTDFLQLLVDEQNRKDSNEDIDEDIKQDIEKINQSINKQTKNLQLEEIDVLGTSLIFILAGYETTAATLSYLLHSLAMNPECQQRLYDEISCFGADVDYETIGRMPYLDACVSETLRMYSPLVLTQRIASEDYELGFEKKIFFQFFLNFFF